MDLENKGGFNDVKISLIQGNIMGLLQRSERFQSLVGGADLRAMMDLEQQKDALGCGDTSCLAEIGGALGVPYLMTMSLGRFAAQRVLNLSLFHVDKGKVLHRVSRIFATDRMMLAQLPELIDELLQGAFGRGGKKLKNTASQVASAKLAHAQTLQAQSQRAFHKKPLVWLGLALATGGGLAVALMPSDGDLQEARDDYDRASIGTSAREWERFESLMQQRSTLGIVAPSLLTAGGLTAVLGILGR